MREEDLFRTMVKKRISKASIKNRIRELARQINSDYEDQSVIFLIIANGALIFGSDLVRLISVPLKFDTLSVSTYIGTESTKTLSLNSRLKLDITNQNIVIADDIFDTGYTLSCVFEIVRKFKPKTIKSCVLISKRKNRTLDFTPDYVGFEIDDEFVVGYGLDYNEDYRNLEYIGVLNQSIYK